MDSLEKNMEKLQGHWILWRSKMNKPIHPIHLKTPKASTKKFLTGKARTAITTKAPATWESSQNGHYKFWIDMTSCSSRRCMTKKRHLPATNSKSFRLGNRAAAFSRAKAMFMAHSRAMVLLWYLMVFNVMIHCSIATSRLRTWKFAPTTFSWAWQHISHAPLQDLTCFFKLREPKAATVQNCIGHNSILLSSHVFNL